MDNTIIIEAIEQDYPLRDIKRFIENSEDLEARSPSGLTALAMAVICNKFGALNALIKAGSDVNARDILGRTPLHWAALRGHLRLAKLLVNNDADIYAASDEGELPKDLASRDSEVYDYLESLIPKYPA